MKPNHYDDRKSDFVFGIIVVVSLALMYLGMSLLIGPWK